MALIIGLGSICSSHDYYGQGDGNFGTCRMKKIIFFLGILYGFVFIYIYACIFASQLTFKRSDFPWFSLVWSGFFFKKKTRATSSMLITFTVFNWKVKANKFQSWDKSLLRPRFTNSRSRTRDKSRFYFWHFLRPTFSVQISNFYIESARFRLVFLVSTRFLDIPSTRS